MLIRTPFIIGADALPLLIMGKDIENPDALASDTSAMERFIREVAGGRDLDFVRWDYLASHRLDDGIRFAIAC
jgi:hypothetical protein